MLGLKYRIVRIYFLKMIGQRVNTLLSMPRSLRARTKTYIKHAFLSILLRGGLNLWTYQSMLMRLGIR